MSKSIQSNSKTSKTNRSLDNWTRYQPHFESDDLNPSLAVSPWAGHRRFSYDLIAFYHPSKIVELGSHYGCSFFAFLQAAKDLNLEIEYTAIDTWEGEAHSGVYTDEVYSLFRETVDALYANQSVCLLRKTFDSALSDIEDNSIDLLHIDGFHSYEAVKHDFETWLGKLALEGIVFFHDIAPSSGYGSATYWKELKIQYEHLEFLDHSFGLGILFPKGTKVLREMELSGCLDWLEIYRFQSEFELKNLQYSDSKELLEKRWESMQSMEALIRDRDEANTGQAEMLEKRWAIMQSMDSKIQQQNQRIDSLSKELLKSEEAATNQEHTIHENNTIIRTITRENHQKNEIISKFTTQFNHPIIRMLSRLKIIKPT